MSAAVRPGEIALEFELDQAAIDLWADLSGDHNPLHVDPASRFGSTIAHGQLALAFVSELFCRELGGNWCRRGVLSDVRFRSPLLPGHRYRVSAEAHAAGLWGRVWRFALRDRADDHLCVEGSATP